jgi:galactokinase
MTGPDTSIRGETPDAPLSAEAKALLSRTDEAFAREGQPDTARCITRAPGPLDVMGGISEYSGAVVLGYPLGDGVTVTVQPRETAEFVIIGLGTFQSAQTGRIVVPAADVFGDDVRQNPSSLAQRFDAAELLWVRAIVGALYAMRVSGKVEADQLGATIVVDSSLPRIDSCAFRAAVAVSVIAALSKAWALRFEPAEAAILATRGENDIGGLPCGTGPALSVLHSRSGMLTPIDCRANAPLAPAPMPTGVTLVGVDCGSQHKNATEKYRHARTATFMGRVFIRQINDGSGGDPHLGSVARQTYVDHLRDKIPTKMRGSDFLARFGETGDPLTRVQADSVYKIRSRTEHHIYEARRTHELLQYLNRVTRTNDRAALIEAGELMHASHWSYGQRCGLGSIATDDLVGRIRKRGTDAGLFGARISGHGAGGVVVVMMEDSEAAREALRDAIDEFERSTSLRTTTFSGSSPGLLEFGIYSE